jgi:predicted unusual protein kinase regulating ubiquinone biosynthesis (AarF/ABC1/UbiB family)
MKRFSLHPRRIRRRSHTKLYAEISANPIAAASLGQVYKARLHSGEVVAVKVQRPDIKDGIAQDMYILRGLAIWAKQNIKRIRSDLKAILDEFASRIFEEMDYVLEGQNAEKFASSMAISKAFMSPRSTGNIPPSGY